MNIHFATTVIFLKQNVAKPPLHLKPCDISLLPSEQHPWRTVQGPLEDPLPRPRLLFCPFRTRSVCRAAVEPEGRSCPQALNGPALCAAAHAVPGSGMRRLQDPFSSHAFFCILHILSQLSPRGKAIPHPSRREEPAPAATPLAPRGPSDTGHLLWLLNYSCLAI